MPEPGEILERDPESEAVAERSSATIEEIILETREKEESSNLRGGANKCFFIKLKDDGAGVFKPKSGETEGMRDHSEAGTYYKRERAAFLVDKFLGFDLVPPTVIRKENGEIGSMQEFIPDPKEAYILLSDNKKRNRYIKDQMMKLWVFDYIIHNSDRHPGNCLVKDDTVRAIDHGFCFSRDSLRRECEIFWDKPITSEIKEKLQAFLAQKDMQRVLGDLLSELLFPEEIEALLNRIKAIEKVIREKGRVPIDLAEQLTFNPKELA